MGQPMTRALVPTLGLWLLAAGAGDCVGADTASPLPDVVAPAAPPVLRALDPSQVQLRGWLGARVDANESKRLLVVDTKPLLDGFQHRPGNHPWIGEHVGKWMHAATLAWANTGDGALRRKLDDVAAQLIAAQEPDGYLGTYAPDKRFGLYDGADWDVWSQNYCLVGLLTYYRYTGNKPALEASRRIADLLVATFPARKSILAAGTHMGMAATSVLSPIVDLYRLTGDARYLEFARYIVRSYEEPGGPDIVRTLLAPGGSVAKVANGKAYEMLYNLLGLVELNQVTGDARLLRAAENAWSDITSNRMYVTGTASIGECFGASHELPNGEDAHLGETCVTTTWIQLNAALLQQTGLARYGDEIERSLYNHLAAAQDPADGDWCYYTALEGAKHYDKDITCCHSSGPRAMALAPQLAYLQGDGCLVVSTLESSRARFVAGGAPVEVVQESRFPYEGRSVLTIRAAQPVRFSLRVRAPPWAAPMAAGGGTVRDGWLVLPERAWREGDQVALSFRLGSRVLRGEYTNYSHIAYAWGPFVLAAEGPPGAEGTAAPQFTRAIEGRTPALLADSGPLLFQVTARDHWDLGTHQVRLVPFADAGLDGDRYAVWLRGP
jgi:DUF1680 family protein